MDWFLCGYSTMLGYLQVLFFKTRFVTSKSDASCWVYFLLPLLLLIIWWWFIPFLLYTILGFSPTVSSICPVLWINKDFIEAKTLHILSHKYLILKTLPSNEMHFFLSVDYSWSLMMQVMICMCCVNILASSAPTTFSWRKSLYSFIQSNDLQKLMKFNKNCSDVLLKIVILIFLFLCTTFLKI
jgi:hypothetical protein